MRTLAKLLVLWRADLARWFAIARSALIPPHSLPARSDYKPVWNKLSMTEDMAKLAVSGYVDEELYLATAQETRRNLESTVSINPDDVVLEIGCGVGRVGMVIAPLCKHWIGCDVSSNMLKHARKRLTSHNNVSFVELSGFDLKPVADRSVDMVYCTVVFMHLDEWDRFRYVRESHRVLRPGGRIFVDNFDLCSDEGWSVFEQQLAISPNQRAPHVSKSSTPQELETYLRRAGFHSVMVEQCGTWVRGWGVK